MQMILPTIPLTAATSRTIGQPAGLMVMTSLAAEFSTNRMRVDWQATHNICAWAGSPEASKDSSDGNHPIP
jgi:hypothetical protein